MHRPREACRFAGHLALVTLCIVLTAVPSAQVPLRPAPEALAASYFTDHAEAVRAALPEREFRALQKAVQEFDFEAALRCLRMKEVA